MNQWEKLATDEQLQKTATALEANGIKTVIVDTAEEAKETVLGMIPEKASVMTMTSETLKETGIEPEVSSSGTYDAIHPRLLSMDRKTQDTEMRMLRSAPDYALGSVHAVTEDGHVIIASRSGSQIPAYTFGAKHVIWIVGAQKVVKNTDEGIKRVYEYDLPLESERAKKAYGVEGSHVNKLLIYNREDGERLTLIFVKQKLGY